MQCHQLDHMQTISTSLQTDNHTNTSSLSFYRPDALRGTQPTVSKHWRQIIEQAIIKHCCFYFFSFLFPIFRPWFSPAKETRVSFWVHVKTAYFVIWYHCLYSTIPLLIDHRWHLVLMLDYKLSALTGRGDCWLTEDKLDIRLYCSWNKLSNRQTDLLITITSSPVGAE